MASRSDRYKQNTKKNVKSTKNNKKTKQVKKVKIKYKKLLMFLLIFSIIIFAAISFFKQNITNIYISGNEKLTEQEIIDIAKVSNYPNTFLNLSSTIKNRLEKNVYIKSAKVYKKSFTVLYIEVEENRPLFYNSSSNETVLLDGKTVQEKLEAPVLINMIPDRRELRHTACWQKKLLTAEMRSRRIFNDWKKGRPWERPWQRS